MQKLSAFPLGHALNANEGENISIIKFISPFHLLTDGHGLISYSFDKLRIFSVIHANQNLFTN